MPLKVMVMENSEQVSDFAATQVLRNVNSNPKAVLGLPTGSTPLGMYKTLVDMHKQGLISFRDVTTFNLDEYVGLNPQDTNSYHYYMYENFFRHVDISEMNIHIPDGNAPDLEGECQCYERTIEDKGGIDLMLLGLGVNGHIGFNEPGPSFSSVTHKVDLDKSTIEANARFFRSVSEVPTSALTMGIGSIMRSRRIILLATGDTKRFAVRNSIECPVTPQVPASILRLHPNATFVLDKDAASLLDFLTEAYGGMNK